MAADGAVAAALLLSHGGGVCGGGVRGRAPRLRVLSVDVRLRAEEQADDLQGAAAGGGFEGCSAGRWLQAGTMI